MNLREYQKEILEKINKSDKNQVVQLDTGGGKTHIISSLAKSYENVIVVAHRNILIEQLSKSMASFNIFHDIVASKKTISECVIEHRYLFKKSFYQQKSTIIVCSIDSFASKLKRNQINLDNEKDWLIIIDEAHHIVKDNKWSILFQYFNRYRLIGFTATPCRADGKGLGRYSSGFFDELVQSDELKTDSVNKLIKKGFLSDFKVFSFEYHINEGDNNIKKSYYNHLNFKYKKLIIGDCVKQYKRIANNTKALVVCVSIEHSNEVQEEFIKNGVSAASINSRMSRTEIKRRLNLFVNNKIDVLCNVDMLGEGFDLPDIETLILLRLTKSFGLYRQWVGRALRFKKNKVAMIIDHAGNSLFHGLPDKSVEWSLNDGPKILEKNNIVQCKACSHLYKVHLLKCPECSEPNRLYAANAGTVSFDITTVDADLVESIRKKIEIESLQSISKHLCVFYYYWPASLSNTYQRNLTNVQKKSAARTCGTMMYKNISTIVEFFISSIKNEFRVNDINRFLSTDCANDYNFWVDNFTIKDIKSNKRQKCIKVFKKWLKQQ